MGSQVRDKLYHTSQLELVYNFNPQGGYDDRGYGEVRFVRGREDVASFYLGMDQNRMTPRVPKDEIDAQVRTIARAMVANQWLITGGVLTYKHFESQEEPGFIGKFRAEAPKDYGDW